MAQVQLPSQEIVSIDISISVEVAVRLISSGAISGCPNCQVGTVNRAAPIEVGLVEISIDE